MSLKDYKEMLKHMGMRIPDNLEVDPATLCQDQPDKYKHTPISDHFVGPDVIRDVFGKAVTKEGFYGSLSITQEFQITSDHAVKASPRPRCFYNLTAPNSKSTKIPIGSLAARLRGYPVITGFRITFSVIVKDPTSEEVCYQSHHTTRLVHPVQTFVLKSDSLKNPRTYADEVRRLNDWTGRTVAGIVAAALDPTNKVFKTTKVTSEGVLPTVDPEHLIIKAVTQDLAPHAFKRASPVTILGWAIQRFGPLARENPDFESLLEDLKKSHLEALKSEVAAKLKAEEAKQLKREANEDPAEPKTNKKPRKYKSPDFVDETDQASPTATPTLQVTEYSEDEADQDFEGEQDQDFEDMDVYQPGDSENEA